jgi:Ca2+-binding RTX toxin-like protein
VYSGNTGVLVDIDSGTGDDGASGEGDTVSITVEDLTGGSARDVLVGSSAANILRGNGGADTLNGQDGSDTLIGGEGGDDLAGLVGRDSYDAGPGNDTIDARDGVRESIACGDGLDTLFSDLFDPRPADCEAIKLFAVDDGPPATIRSARVRGRTAVIRLFCPRAAKTACAGTMTLRSARGGSTLGSKRYRVALGRRGTVTVPLRRSAGRRVSVETVENGVSDKGPRRSLRTLRAR